MGAGDCAIRLAERVVRGSRIVGTAGRTFTVVSERVPLRLPFVPAETAISPRIQREFVSRTSISIRETTKDRLDSLKGDDETWDEFLTRLAADEEPIEFDVLSRKEGERIKQQIREGRERGRSYDWGDE